MDEIFFDTSFSLVYEDDSFAEGEDLLAHSAALGSGIDAGIHGVEGEDDLIFMDLSDIFTHDHAYDHESCPVVDMDILLGSKDAFHSVKDMFDHNENAIMEMAVLGDNFQGQNMQEVLHGVGITKNTDGSISLGQGWQVSSSQGANFNEYTHSESDTTLFVHQTLIVTGS